jgi:PAS domain S-box-containing protein
MPITSLAPLRRYGFALLTVGLATAIRVVLNPILGDRFPFLTFFIAIVVTAWYGGFGPSLLAVGLSWLAADRLVLQPNGSVPFFPSKPQLVFAFIVIGLTVALLGEGVRVARRRSRVNASKAHRALEDLRGQREWLRITLDSIADAVITTDPGGIVVSLNPVAVALTGWASAEAAGRPLKEVFRTVEEASHRTDELPIARLVLGEAVPPDGPSVLVARDGTTRTVERNLAPLKDDRGRVMGVVVVFRDVTERRRVEQARRSLAAIVEFSDDAILSKDTEGVIRSWNAAAERLYGYPAAEVVGKPFSILVPSGRGAEIEESVRRLRRGERLDYLETVRRKKDGGLIDVSVSYSPIQDDEGRFVGTAVIARDVSQRRRAEAAMRAGEERLRLALEAGRMGVWDWNILNGEIRWSENLEPIHGLAPGIFADSFEAFEELIHPDDRDSVSKAITRSIEDRSGYDIEFRIVWPDGSVHWMASKGQVFTGDDGTPTRMLGVVLDTTGRKLAEERLKESEQRFARFMQHLPGLAWIKDLEGRYVFANEAAQRAFRTALPHLYHKTDDDVFPPETAAVFRENDRRALSAETGLQTVESLEHDDGIVHHSIVSKFPIFGQDGEVALIGGIAIDITDRMRMEESLREADRSKDEFIATLAHELRNPLAPIQNALYLMKRTAGNGHGFEAERAMAERQVKHLARLVDDLMDVSRINRGKIELRKEVLELASVVERAAESVRSLLQDQGHDLSVHLTREPIHLEADPTRLEQVLGNLLNNAIKYTDRGGRIALEVERHGDEAVLRVRDNGIGLEPETRARIFEMFTQVGRHADRSQGGLGIGLGLVRRLVELHGGTVTAHSRGLGSGSEFVVRLPVLPHAPGALGQDPSAPIEAPPPDSKPARRRILVVDDNHDAAHSLARVLTRLFGQEVQVAHDGPSALDAAPAFRPNLILLDIGMPGMDGNEVARRLRAQPGFETTLIVALTGWGQESDVERSREAGFDRHLVKPANLEAIRALLIDPKSEGRDPTGVPKPTAKDEPTTFPERTR